MVDHTEIEARAERMRVGLMQAYGIRAGDLPTALARAERHLPRSVRAAVADVAGVLQLDGHPKLMRLIDPGRLQAAEATLAAHLKTVDRAADRRAAWLDWAAEVGFYVLVVAAGFVIWLVASGHV